MAFRGYGKSISLRLDRELPLSCEPDSPANGVANYLQFGPPISHVSLYPAIVCRDTYTGIDWKFHTENGRIEHDWQLSPYANVRDIVLRLDQGVVAHITSNGDLVLRSGDLHVSWKSPLTYQFTNGARRVIPTHYRLRGRRITLEVASYRHDLPLVIDPIIDFSYVINGEGDDRGCQVALDGAGNIFIAGFTESTDFQTTPGAVSTPPIQFPGSAYQLFVRKLAPDGKTLLYSTYLGTARFNSSHPFGMRVDSSGNVYIAANIFNDQATLNTTIDLGGVVGVYKLAPGGDRLLYSTRVLSGFSYVEPVALAIDSSGSAYAAIGTTKIGVSKLDPTGKNQVYLYQATVSNYPGNPGGIADVAIGPDGTAYIAGTTAMGGLVTTTGSLNPNPANIQNNHGYLIRLKADGSAPIFSTYIAGSYVDSIGALAVDSAGNALVGGQTSGVQGSPALNGTTVGSVLQASTNAFVMKVNPAGSARAFTTLLPSSSVLALSLDPAGNIYTAGLASSSNTLVVSKVSPAGNQLLYQSSLPGDILTGDQGPVAMTADSTGAAYITGSIADVRIPSPLLVTRLAPNAFLLKMDPNPDSCDLELVAAPVPTYLPNDIVPVTFTVRNHGPSTAQNVAFSGTLQGGSIVNCSISAAGGSCASDFRVPLAMIPNIPAGGSATIQFNLNASSAIALSGTISTASSDVNQGNNATTASAKPNYSLVSVTSNFQAPFTLNGILMGSPFFATPGFPVAPNSQIQIGWPSPEQSAAGTAVFQRWQDGSTDNPRTFTVTQDLSVRAILSTLATPFFSAAVANAGSYAANGISPGELVTLSGFVLGDTALAQPQDGKYPTALGSATVTFDGTRAPLIYTSATQIDAIVPYEVAGKASTTVAVQTKFGSFSAQVPIVQAVPALFTSNASGSGQAAALNQDLSLNSSANPANPGDTIVLFGTGEGIVSPLPSDGSISPYPAPSPQLPVTVNIGGVPAQAQYAAEAPGLVAGVIQINAVIPQGIAYSHHVPVTWSAGPFSSPSGVTIAVKDSPKPAPVYQPITGDSSLFPISVLPSHIAADSNATTVSIYGSGFVNGMVAEWNNQPRTTTFVSSSQLKVTLSGDDLESPQLGSITVWDASQTTRISQQAPLIVYLALLNHDVVYDDLRDLVYVSVAAAQQPQGASIATVNPETGQIERVYSLNDEPGQLTVSGDHKYLYVALSKTVRRIALDTWTDDLDIPLGQPGLPGTLTAFSMTTLPGQSRSLAVSFIQLGLSPPYVGTAVFDDAELRGFTLVGTEYLFGGPSPGTLYGGDMEGGFHVLQVDSTGVHAVAEVQGLLGGDGDSVYAGGLVYSGWGSLIDPVAAQTITLYDNQGPIVPLPSSNQALILGGVPPPGYLVTYSEPVLTLHDSKTGIRRWSVPLPIQFYTNHARMFGWGTNGVGLRELGPNTSVAQGIDLFRLNLGQ